jgi:DNA-binding MarR family transcriptional regulator
MLDAIEAAEKNGEQLGVTAIAQSIGVDQPRASRLVQEGTEAGYLRRAVDASDARRAVVQLTAAGRRHLTEVRETRTSAISGAIEGFSPDELSTFATLFDRFVRAWPRD